MYKCENNILSGEGEKGAGAHHPPTSSETKLRSVHLFTNIKEYTKFVTVSGSRKSRTLSSPSRLLVIFLIVLHRKYDPKGQIAKINISK